MTIEKAIEKVKKKYLEAFKNESIRDPVAWSLYQIWKEADTEKVNMKLRCKCGETPQTWFFADFGCRVFCPVCGMYVEAKREKEATRKWNKLVRSEQDG